MKFFTCVFLVLVILEEYQCEPCLDWLFGRRSRDNGKEIKLGIDAGFTVKTMISGHSEHPHEDDHSPSYHLHHGYPQYNQNVIGNRPRYQPDFRHHGYPSYRQNGLGHRPSLYPYHPYYPPSTHPWHRTPYSTHYGRPFGATYNIPYGWKGGASNGLPQYGTPYHRDSYGLEYDTPRHETLYPTPFDTAHQTPNVVPSGSAYGAPNGSPNSTPNGTPAQIPVETDDGTPQRKHFFVTPTGIEETAAQPVDDITS